MKSKFSPYQLVYVNHPNTHAEGGRFGFIGQVMSYPIDVGQVVRDDIARGAAPSLATNQTMRELSAVPTIMVRRVPGHPGTLQELPLGIVSELDAPRNKWKYVSYAYVSRRGSHPFDMFPVDMLRYDCCAPLNFALAEDSSYGGVRADLDPQFGFDRLVVAKVCERKYGRWTERRWESFGWTLEEFDVMAIADDARATFEARPS